jgi:L-2-hydroxyglutarate oxidase
MRRSQRAARSGRYFVLESTPGVEHDDDEEDEDGHFYWVLSSSRLLTNSRGNPSPLRLASDMASYDYAIVGGGIVGLAVARALGQREPKARLLLIEKESAWARHQTGHNSGVIHSGIYYAPGSLKARLSRAGSQSMVAFCRKHNLPHEVCGKVIVATEDRELPLLERLFQRGQANGLDVQRLSAEQVRELEPHVRCRQGIRVPTTGIVDYRQVCVTLAGLIEKQGGELQLNTRLRGVREQAAALMLETTQGVFETRFLVNCAGLHSDRVARLADADPVARIIPFRGEYYELKPERRGLVKGLIYPVPNPDFPFLGVHFTRMIDGSVHAGPNAVLSFKREGYHRTDFNLRDLAETFLFAGFWRMLEKNLREGLKEMHRSFSKPAFVRSLQALIPEVQSDDLVPSEAGVRAQALQPDGKLVDDFLFVRGSRSLHVCNAPSPAATASLEIAKVIVEQVPAD